MKPFIATREEKCRVIAEWIEPMIEEMIRKIVKMRK